jgi:hypothetical protein
MKKQLKDQLRIDYPLIFADQCGIEVGDGWFDLIDVLCDTIESHISHLPEDLQNQIYAIQIKEKYGSLRFYMSHDTPFIDGAIAVAETMSLHVCEICGRPGRQRLGGWIRTLCDGCHEEQSK